MEEPPDRPRLDERKLHHDPVTEPGAGLHDGNMLSVDLQRLHARYVAQQPPIGKREFEERGFRRDPDRDNVFGVLHHISREHPAGHAEPAEPDDQRITGSPRQRHARSLAIVCRRVSEDVPDRPLRGAVSHRVSEDVRRGRRAGRPAPSALLGEEGVGVDDRVGVALFGQEPLSVLGEVRVDGVTRHDAVEAGGATVALGPE